MTASRGYSEDMRLAHVLADQADSLSLERFRAQDLRVETKPDLTPVTDADRAVEEQLRITLSRARTRDGHALALRAELFGEVARAAAEAAPPPEPLSDDPAQDAVLSAFVRDGRLTSIPVQLSKRRVVLDHIVRVFEPGVRYPEREVNALLAVWHPDVAALRRYLVDEGLLSREAGVYWRTGGYVDV